MKYNHLGIPTTSGFEGKKVIIQPNSPSEGLVVAFIEVNGAPVELMQYIDNDAHHYSFDRDIGLKIL